MRSPQERFRQSPATIAVIQHLRGLKVGTIATWKELAEVVGTPRDTADLRMRRGMVTARNVLLRDYGIVYGAVWGVGVRRLDDEGKLGDSDNDITLIRKKALKAGKKLATVDFTNLDRGQQSKLAARQVVLSVISREVKHSTLEKLTMEAATAPNSKDLKRHLLAMVGGAEDA